MGFALYRSGKYEESIKKLNEAANSRATPAPSAWIFLAMAHHQLGQKEEAQKWLKKASTWFEEARKKDAEMDPKDMGAWKNLLWNQRVMLEVTFREAQQLVKDSGKK